MADTISVDVLAEALRKALNPTQNERLALQERPEAPEPERVACVSPTGARFTAVIAPSRTHPEGRVVKLDDYLYPSNDILRACGYPCADGPETFVLPGNVMYPDGHKDAGKLTPDAKQYVWTSTYQADLRTFVGKPLDWQHRADTQHVMDELKAKMAAAAAKAQAEAVARHEEAKAAAAKAAKPAAK